MAQTSIKIAGQSYRIKPQTVSALRAMAPISRRIDELEAELGSVDARLVALARERFVMAETGEVDDERLAEIERGEVELRERAEDLYLRLVEARLERLAQRVEPPADAPAVTELDVRDLDAIEAELMGLEERPTGTPA